jgi:hypothetical protein
MVIYKSKGVGQPLTNPSCHTLAMKRLNIKRIEVVAGCKSADRTARQLLATPNPQHAIRIADCATDLPAICYIDTLEPGHEWTRMDTNVRA